MGYELQRKVVSNGNIPAGAAIIFDGVVFDTVLSVSDTTQTPNDTSTYDIDASYSDAQSTPTENSQFGVSGYQDFTPVPTESRTSSLTRWATSFTTSGTAPTNPNNALFENNGTQAVIKAGGIPSVGSSLFLTIAAPLTNCGISPTCVVYFQTLPAATGDTLVQYLDYRQLGLGSNTRVNFPIGNFSITPYSVVLTNIDAAFPVLPAFGILSTVSATGGQVNIDAVGIVSTGVI